MNAVGHIVTVVEKKHVLLRGSRAEFSVTVCVKRTMEKYVLDTVGLIVIQET